LFKSIKEGEIVTLKCYGFGISVLRYFACDILGKEDAIRNNGTKNHIDI
jgi:hypothetical protein